MPTTRLFSQFVAQANFDVSGSTVTYLGQSERLHEQSLLFLDLSMGYWIYQTKRHDFCLTGIAPMIELHYNTTLEDADVVDAADADSTGSTARGFDTVTNFRNRLDVLNLTGAVRLELAGTSYLTFFGVAPLRSGDDKLFDAEFGVQFSRFY